MEKLGLGAKGGDIPNIRAYYEKMQWYEGAVTLINPFH
jgi:hypothetical protein